MSRNITICFRIPFSAPLPFHKKPEKSRTTLRSICTKLIALQLSLLLLAGCSSQMTLKDAEKEPNFSGVVTKVTEHTILVRVGPEEDEYRSSDLLMVSLLTEIEGDGRTFQVGDEVRVYYDGMIAETYPAQINRVYAVTLIESTENTESTAGAST